MDIIVRGNPQEIDFVRRICRDKVSRGLLAILPAPRPAHHTVEDTKDAPSDDFKETDPDADTKDTGVTDTKDVPAEDAKVANPKKTSRSKK